MATWLTLKHRAREAFYFFSLSLALSLLTSALVGSHLEFRAVTWQLAVTSQFDLRLIITHANGFSRRQSAAKEAAQKSLVVAAQVAQLEKSPLFIRAARLLWFGQLRAWYCAI